MCLRCNYLLLYLKENKMNKKTLLLSCNWEALCFISERRAFKLIFNEKADMISDWNEDVSWSNGSMKHPSVLRLKNNFRRTYVPISFSRRNVIRRDRSTCQYCSKQLSVHQISIDHVFPKSRGGINSFKNCVTSCKSCNAKKDNRTPEEAEMKLIKMKLTMQCNMILCFIF